MNAMDPNQYNFLRYLEQVKEALGIFRWLTKRFGELYTFNSHAGETMTD